MIKLIIFVIEFLQLLSSLTGPLSWMDKAQ